MMRPSSWMLLASLLLGVSGCSGAKEAASDTAPAVNNAANPTTEVKPTDEPSKAVPPAPAVEISPFVHHAATDVALVIARPSRILNNPILTEMVKEIEAADPSVKFEDQLKKFEDELQIDPKQIEYVVVSVSSKTLAAVSPKPPSETEFRIPPESVPTDPGPSDASPKVPGTDPPSADPNADESSIDESAAADDEEQATPAAESTGESEGDMASFEPPPAPAILVRLLTPIDGDAKVVASAARERARVEELTSYNESNYEGLPKDYAEQVKKEDEANRQRMLKACEVHKSDHSGVTLYQKGEVKDRLCFLNSQTILYGPEEVVKAAIDRKGIAEAAPLSGQMQALVDRDFAIAIDLAPVDAMSKSGQLQLPFPVQLFAAPLLKCRYLSLAADINGGNLLQVNLVAADEAGAKQLHGMLNPLLKDGIAKAKAAKDAPGQIPAEASPFLPLGEQILDGTLLTQTGDLISLVVARPAGLADLPTLARPMIVEAAKRSGEARARNDLKYIALAMHNFHESYSHFPSNHQGDTDSVGLSWRVHILPFVGEAGLYQEFHMDEPWDSEHNKTLIPRMPKVYGTNAEGKSSIHVFVGEGTPFGGKPLSFRDITDGTSNTIMFLRAGEDTADVWTKPGGVTFDKENPISALGNIGDRFDVGFMDGSVRSLSKTIDAATFGKLILHNDGNPVEIPD